MSMKRYIFPYIEKDLGKKMVFLGGARQVGKTTLSQKIGKAYFPHFEYLNWDFPDDRQKIHKLYLG